MKIELTDKQQSIIEDITNEFIQINEKKKQRKSGGLLNLENFIYEKQDDMEDRENIATFNNAKFKETLLIVDEAIETLNTELLDYGLMAYRYPNLRWENNLSSIYFYIDTKENAETNINRDRTEGFHKSSRYSISLWAKNKTKTITFKSNIEAICQFETYLGIGLASSYERTYPTIDEFCADKNFRGGLQSYIKDNF
jgi:hypothetical protein